MVLFTTCLFTVDAAGVDGITVDLPELMVFWFFICLLVLFGVDGVFVAQIYLYDLFIRKIYHQVLDLLLFGSAFVLICFLALRLWLFCFICCCILLFFGSVACFDGGLDLFLCSSWFCSVVFFISTCKSLFWIFFVQLVL